MKILDLTNLSVENQALLNDTAQEIRKEYNTIIESLSSPHFNKIDWIVCSIASRNKYYSPLFFRLCQIAFLEKVLKNQHDINIIILNDKPLSIVLKKHYKSIKIICTEKISLKIFRIMTPFRQYIIAIILLFFRYIARSRKTINNIPHDKYLTLIDTFVLNNKSGDEGSIKNGIYKDRYYPGLLENLTDEEKETIFFLPTIVGFNNPIKIFKEIRKSKTKFIVHDDFLKISDYLFALMHPFRLLKCRIDNTLFRKINITSLIRNENRNNASNFIGLLGLLYYRFALQLSNQNIKVRLLVDWHENQVIDRGMIVGFHKFYPHTKIIGYQGYIIAKSLHIYTIPNNTEYLGKAVPDIISVVGSGLKNNMFEFCDKLSVEVGPGFRFQKLWRDRIYFPYKNHYTILVGLPIGLDDSKKILSILTEALSTFLDTNVRFWVKPHPTWSPEKIKSLFPENYWPEAFEFKIGDFHDSIENANLLITNASSVSLEALAKGVPVIIIGSQNGINQNPIPENIAPDIWTLAYTSEQCINAIKKFQDTNKNFFEYGIKIRENFFEPVNRKNTLKFLNLN